MNSNFKRYIIFWLSQALSQLGSSMTTFALILWTYTQKGTAMTVSLMTFFNYLPYIILSLFVGTFVDNHSKKKIMLVSDSIAAICSLAIFCLYLFGKYDHWFYGCFSGSGIGCCTRKSGAEREVGADKRNEFIFR